MFTAASVVFITANITLIHLLTITITISSNVIGALAALLFTNHSLEL